MYPDSYTILLFMMFLNPLNMQVKMRVKPLLPTSSVQIHIASEILVKELEAQHLLLCPLADRVDHVDLAELVDLVDLLNPASIQNLFIVFFQNQ